MSSPSSSNSSPSRPGRSWSAANIPLDVLDFITAEDPEDTWELFEKIGTGAHGTVFKAVNRLNGREAAIKQMKIDPKNLPEIKREVVTIAELSGPFCVEYFASYFKDGDLWLAMELFDAGSVGDLLEKKQRMSEEQIVALLLQTCRCMDFLHARNKVHRDIKAGNLMLNRKGIIKLGDFGLCSSLDASSKLNTQVGSPFWMAPEIIAGESYDSRADIWSLGITIIEATHREHEFFNRNPMTAMFQIVSDDPPSVEDPSLWSPNFLAFLRLCLTKDPADRPSAALLLQHPLLQVDGDRSEVLMRLVEECGPLKSTLSHQYILDQLQGAGASSPIAIPSGNSSSSSSSSSASSIHTTTTSSSPLPQRSPASMESTIVSFAMPDGTYRRLLVTSSMTVRDIILKIAQKICLDVDQVDLYSLSYLRKENLIVIQDTSTLLLPLTKQLQSHSKHFTFRQEPDTASFALLNDCLMEVRPTLLKQRNGTSSTPSSTSRSDTSRASPGSALSRSLSSNLTAALSAAHPAACQQFLSLIFAPNLPLVTGLLKVIPSAQSDRLVHALVDIFEAASQAPRVFRRACEVEVLNIDPSKVNDLFRGNSLTGKMMTAYVKQVGTEYAQLVLSPILQPLLQLKAPLELDTNRMDKSSNLIQDLLLLRTNMLALQKITRDIFQSLFLSIDSMPVSFRLICRELQMTVTHYFRDKQQFVPTSFIFLRYLCPIIVSPFSFGICSEAPQSHVTRTLVLLSKIINALASGVHFGAKEEYMSDMNPFLDEYRPMVTRYFDRLLASVAPRFDTHRRSVIIKSISTETSDSSSSQSIDLKHPSCQSHLHYLMNFTDERFLHIGAALNILPPVPLEL